ncbi:MAG: class I SAM-dependent methyltransferase [Calditrichaeota bacterium]|nr:class I SAM-dependent methyltransferase [Calditrichota bacterium]MCB9365630.1 class I SAM-dependent methyltransferase [Calditrichota bacterium]
MMKEWLDARYQRQADGTYYAHSPIYGPGQKKGKSERGIAARYIRIENVIRALRGLGIGSKQSIVDVGASEGHFLSVAREKLGCAVTGTDISAEACKRAEELFGITAVPSEATSLPFSDKQFDAAVCMETLEHVPRIHEAIGELLRVAHCVVITVPNESLRKTTRTHLGIHPHGHIWNFNAQSFDFLKTMGYGVKAVRHTSTAGLVFYMALEKLGLLNEMTLKLCLAIDRQIQSIPPSWGWMFIVTEPNHPHSK